MEAATKQVECLYPDRATATVGVCAISLLAFGLCSPLGAQSQSQTSPPGFDWRDAPNTSRHFGGYRDARFQFLDGSLTGPAMLLRQIDLRLDSTRSVANCARSWEKVMLLAAPCDYRHHGTVLDENATGARQLAFVGRVSWPQVAVRVLPPKAPVPAWGGPGLSYRFPFRSPYLKRKGEDLLLDFYFSRGNLELDAVWAQLTPYALDGVDELDHVRGPLRTGGSQPCGKVTCRVELLAFRPDAADTMRAGMLEAWLTADGLSQGTRVVQALGLGVDNMIANSCPSAYLRRSLFAVTTTADRSGRAAFLLGRIPCKGVVPETLLAAQAGYQDQNTGKLRLTQATQTAVPHPPKPYSFDRVFYMALSPTAKESVFLDHQSQPVFCYG
ncbi:MAG: hypothetical protein ACYTGW_02940 [Planctomycetota bacterium]|jgi:hypothetical protein